jgi:hypothetical protein
LCRVLKNPGLLFLFLETARKPSLAALLNDLMKYPINNNNNNNNNNNITTTTTTTTTTNNNNNNKVIK